MTALGRRTVEIERRIAAAPETVFGYLIDPERFRRWQGVDAELDPRPGGIFRVTTIAPPHYTASGSYVEIDPPSRVVFTWGWEPHDDLDDGQRAMPPGTTKVEIMLLPDRDGTILRLRHSGLPHEAACAFHTAGWEWTLDQLAAGTA